MGEEKRQVRDPGCCDDQDPPEEGDQGREARDVRQSRPGEGEASKDHRQGFPRESPQGRVLRVSRSVASPARRLRVSFCPGWLEVRGHSWLSGLTTLGEGAYMYSTSGS